jgi:nucleotide-binding universal stress UspA family protein
MDEFKNELEELVPTDSRAWCEPECVLEYGHAADAILILAKERNADLIVMGARPAPVLLSHFRAGVAYKVIAGASCPVLTVCPHE